MMLLKETNQYGGVGATVVPNFILHREAAACMIAESVN